MRRAVFPLAGLTIEIEGDQATVNGLPVEAAEAERMLDQYLRQLLEPPRSQRITLAAPAVISFAAAGADPGDPSAWTDLGVSDGPAEIEYDVDVPDRYR